MNWKILVLSLSLVGCEKAKSVIGLEKEDPEITKQRLADEKQLKENQLKEGDALVQKWADQLVKTATDEGFPRQEGLIDLDPWGNPLRIDYRQEWFNEIAIIRSAGPDGKYDTVDDLIRTRKASNPSGILHGINTAGWLGIIWISTGLLSFLFAAGIGNNRRNKGKSSKHRNPIAFFIATLLLAPLVVFIYGLQYIGGALGAAGDFFDGFEFDFDIDL